MARRIFKAAASAILALAVSGGAYAQRRYSDEEIVAAISKCLIENAPDNWQTVIFTMEQAPAVAGRPKSATIEHKVIAGAESNPPRDLKPCRADYARKAVETFRESQDEKARRWTGITVTAHRDGRFSVTYRYPK